MKKLLKSFRYGQRGFTLIELLVVVAILGILAAIIIPNVAKFMGTGAVEGANTEAHNVQLAAIAYMVDNTLVDLDGTIGDDGTTTGGLNATVGAFLMNINDLQALYTITDGAISAATADPTGKWKDLTYTLADGWHPTTTT